MNHRNVRFFLSLVNLCCALCLLIGVIFSCSALTHFFTPSRSLFCIYPFMPSRLWIQISLPLRLGQYGFPQRTFPSENTERNDAREQTSDSRCKTGTGAWNQPIEQRKDALWEWNTKARCQRRTGKSLDPSSDPSMKFLLRTESSTNPCEKHCSTTESNQQTRCDGCHSVNTGIGGIVDERTNDDGQCHGQNDENLS